MPHILLIEEDSPTASRLKRYLENVGYRVTMAFDSITALETVRGKPVDAIDAIITDICMPGLNDKELLPQLRQYLPKLPAIVISGYTKNFISDMDDRTKLFSKPVELKLLVEALNHMLNRHPASGRAAEPKIAALVD